MENYQAIICDPDPDTRIRLLSATSAVPALGQVRQLNRLSEAQDLLAGQEEYDLVFVSYRFDNPSIERFIGEAKVSAQGRHCGYVLVLPAAGQDSSTVARHVMLGMDGFLFEPYSVNSLIEIMEIAVRVRQERLEARQGLAITILLSEIVSQLDMVAVCMANQLDWHSGMKELRRQCAVLQRFDESTRTRYFEEAIRLFGEALPPQRGLGKSSYAGASQRVKKRLAEKLSEQIDEQQQELNRLKREPYRVIRKRA